MTRSGISWINITCNKFVLITGWGCGVRGTYLSLRLRTIRPRTRYVSSSFVSNWGKEVTSHAPRLLARAHVAWHATQTQVLDLDSSLGVSRLCIWTLRSTRDIYTQHCPKILDPYKKPLEPGNGQNSNHHGHRIVEAGHHSLAKLVRGCWKTNALKRVVEWHAWIRDITSHLEGTIAWIRNAAASGNDDPEMMIGCLWCFLWEVRA